MGRNALGCSLRYRTSVDRISNFEFASHNINRYAAASQVDLDTGALLLELLQCRDGSLTLSNDDFDMGDIAIAAMIEILCTGNNNLPADFVVVFCGSSVFHMFLFSFSMHFTSFC